VWACVASAEADELRGATRMAPPSLRAVRNRLGTVAVEVVTDSLALHALVARQATSVTSRSACTRPRVWPASFRRWRSPRSLTTCGGRVLAKVEEIAGAV
jgi:hypothetical protein